MSIKKFMFVLGFFVISISLVFVFQSQFSQVQAQDSESDDDFDKEEEIDEYIIIEDFCNALKKHDMNLLRTCFAATCWDCISLQIEDNDRYLADTYTNLFTETGDLYKFMKGKNNNIDFRVIKILEYKYEVTQANDLGIAKIEFSFKYGADNEIHKISFHTLLISMDGIWYIYTGSKGIDNFFELISRKFKDAVKPAKKTTVYPRDVPERPADDGEEAPAE